MASKPKSKSEARRLAIQKGDKKSKQVAIDMETGEITEVDAEELGMTDADMGIEEEPVRESQAKLVAELSQISLKPGKRVFTLKVIAPKMVTELSRIYGVEKAFFLKFKVPVEAKNDEVTKWEEVEFETRLTSLTLKGGKASCQGNIDHKGAAAMSKLIQSWAGPMQFFLDGIQQTLI